MPKIGVLHWKTWQPSLVAESKEMFDQLFLKVRVLLMLGKMQFELQKLVDKYNKILRITFPTEVTKSESEVFFYKSEPILGFAVSLFSLSVYITVKEHGLPCYNMRKEQLWIAKPDTELFSYTLGCRANCSFDSKPVIDSCETSIYVSNNQGELYSLSLDGSYYKWIRDMSSVDRLFTVKPDSYSGDILWQKTIGPLSETSGLEPVIDVNGWISIGSLDGSLYSFSRTGELRKTPEYPEPDSPIHVAPLLDFSGNTVYFAKTLLQVETNKFLGDKSTNVYAKKPEIAVLSLVVPKTRSIYWSHSYSDQISSLSLYKDVQQFVIDERIVLAFLTASNYGNPFGCLTKHEKLSRSCSLAEPENLDVYIDYIGLERLMIWFMLFQFLAIVLLGALERKCFVFLKKDKLQESSNSRLQNEQTNPDVELGDDKIVELVRQRENVERKHSAEYNRRSLTYGDGDKESAAYFKTPNRDDESSSKEESNKDDQQHCVLDLTRKLKGKHIVYPDDDDDDDDGSKSRLKGKHIAYQEWFYSSDVDE